MTMIMTRILKKQVYNSDDDDDNDENDGDNDDD